MATDFISSKDAKDKHCEICEHLNICYQYDGDDCRTYTGRTCIERQCFNAIPAADVRPVVHGRWIPMTYIRELTESGWPNCRWEKAIEPDSVDGLMCSECGEIFDVADARNFCTQCGSDMRQRSIK